MAVEPSIVHKRFSLVGMEGKIDFGSDFNPDLKALYQKVIDQLDGMRGLTEPVRMVGYWYYPTLGNFEDIRYFAGVEADTSYVPKGLAALNLPDSLFAVFTEQKRGIIGGPEGAGYKWLNESMRRNQYTYNGAIPGDFEVYRNLTDTAPDCEAEIYIPIEKVKG